MVTTPVKKKEDIERMKMYFLKNQKYRDYALFVVGINTALRIGDLLRLKWGSVYDFVHASYLPHILVIEQKTQKKTVSPSMIAV